MCPGAIVTAFSKGIRAFRDGLDRKLFWEYLRAIWDHAWEIFWGAGIIGLICTSVTLYYSPSRWLLGWVVAWVFLVAGYYVWRPYHVRLVPKFEVAEVIAQETDTENPNVFNLFVQIVTKCLTEAPVHGCRGHLQRVWHRDRDDGDWVLTSMNAPEFLGWDYYGIDPMTLEPGIDRRLNICSWSTAFRNIIPSVDPLPSKFRSVFGRAGTFKFDVKLTAADCPSVDVCVTVNIDGREWNKPALELIQGRSN
jgi:hypothetical protein